MSARDRTVLIVVVVLVALGGAWMLAVSPKRQEASKLTAQVAEAKTLLATAEGELAHAHAAQTQYAKAYASIVNLGKAVPPSQEVPSLIYQLTLASNQKKVDFSSISTGGGAAGAAGGSAATTPAAAAGFSQMPFTFVFGGSFFDLEHLFQQLNRFTLRQSSGGLQVSGRLLTMQSVKLAPASSSSQQAGASKGPQELTGTITATAYVLPAAQGLTAGATPTSPAGTTSPATSTTGASSSPTAPAIARVTP
jgi:Type II secretion system (T2SS), protein M